MADFQQQPSIDAAFFRLACCRLGPCHVVVASIHTTDLVRIGHQKNLRRTGAHGSFRVASVFSHHAPATLATGHAKYSMGDRRLLA